MFQLAFGVSRSCFRGLKNPKEELKIPDAPNRALEDSDTDDTMSKPCSVTPGVANPPPVTVWGATLTR